MQGNGLSEVVATLEAEVKTLKAENARLQHDSKAVYNQLRAKDKELDSMAEEVERARAIYAENQVQLISFSSHPSSCDLVRAHDFSIITWHLLSPCLHPSLHAFHTIRVDMILSQFCVSGQKCSSNRTS